MNPRNEPDDAAFPRASGPDTLAHRGMSIRALFACAAMHALLESERTRHWDSQDVARSAVSAADALLKELAEP